MKRVAKWVSRALWGAVFVVIAAVAVGAYLLPQETSVSSNADGTIWRHLDIPTTTTAAPAVRPATDGETWLVVIDGDRVYRLPRTPLTTQLLWMATALEER